MSGVPPVSGPSGGQPNRPNIISRAFFGVTHGADYLVGFARDAILRLRCGTLGELASLSETRPQRTEAALKDIREMITENSVANQKTSSGLLDGFESDLIRTESICIGDKTWNRKNFPENLKEQLKQSLIDLLGTEGAENIQRILYQSLTVNMINKLTNGRPFTFESLATRITIQKQGDDVVLQYQRAETIRNPQDPIGKLDYKRVVTAPLKEIGKNIPLGSSVDQVLPSATSQETLSINTDSWRPFRFPTEVPKEGPVSRLFRWLFSWTLDPVAKKVSQVWNSVFGPKHQ